VRRKPLASMARNRWYLSGYDRKRDGDSRMVEAGKRLAAATKKKLATRGASDATTTTRSRRARWFGARLSGHPRH
jgi:hypothetical protein